MSKALNPDQTGFDVEDLTIRNRVLAYKKALETMPSAAKSRDALLSQFVREVNDLRAQLTQVEAAFGPDDPMAQVLREALASAESRRDTRRIELGEEEGEGEAGRACATKPEPPVARPEPAKACDYNEFMWALILFWSWQRAHPAPAVTIPASRPALP